MCVLVATIFGPAWYVDVTDDSVVVTVGPVLTLLTDVLDTLSFPLGEEDFFSSL